MIGEECITILSEGLSYYQASYKNIQVDVNSEEKSELSKTFTYYGENFKPNSAEKYNLELRGRYHVNSFEIEDISNIYRTRDFQYSYTTQILNTTQYLLSVIKLAIDINNKVYAAIFGKKGIIKNKQLSKDEKEYQILKHFTCTYLDILMEIKTRIDDLSLSPLSHQISKTYSNLDNLVRTLLFTAYIPDELAESFNELYEGISLNKFSEIKRKGVSRSLCMENFKSFTERLYNSGIKLFLSELLNEFSFYVTSDKFLNNPKKKTILVIPLSMYKKFNFRKSGLTRQEIVFLESKDMEKTTENLKVFYNEIYNALNCLYSKVKAKRNELYNIPDTQEIEWAISKYEDFFKNETGGRLTGIRNLNENPAFREKFTRLVYDLRPELIDSLNNNENPWKNQNITSHESKYNDRETLCYLYNLLEYHYSGMKIHTLRLQFVNFLRLYSHCDKPEKSYSRYFKEFSEEKQTWHCKYGERFKKILDL